MPLVLDPPVVQTPVAPAPISIDGLPCEERKASAPSIPKTGMARQILKAYLSSFNLCLRELGWVPKSILEVGSGDGTLLSYVAQTFMDAETYGVEFSAEQIELAKEKNCCRIEFVELTQTDRLPFKDNQFDLVISHGFLGQTDLPRHWAQEMARVTAEGLILSTLSPLGSKILGCIPGAKDAELLGRQVFQPAIRPVGMDALKYWLTRANLTVETTLYPMPFNMMLARKPQMAN